MTLMEIDENLIRHELSAAQKAEHIAVKVDILTKRELASPTIRKTAESAEKQITVSKAEQKKREQRATKAKAKKDAKKHVAASLGHSDSNHVSAAMKDDAAVKAADLDVDKLDELTASQFKEVAKTARTDAGEAKTQLDTIIENGAGTSSKLAKSDATDYIKQQSNTIQSALNAIERLKRTTILTMLISICLSSAAYLDLRDDMG